MRAPVKKKTADEKNKDTMLIGLQTDIRASFQDSKLNPMLSSPLDYLMNTEEELMAFLKQIK
ncbi:MAG: hypothetical protein B6241_11365 [Spirochaetaceae bacterium 4572_59]|nr:MAG: hypothetical protein B6241_11365 [Spirochaetaceae bacterium 4572_59]